MSSQWKRGDIFYVESTMNTETASGRPAVIVSSEKVNDGQMVQVVYLTTNPKMDLSTHIDISSTARTSVALCEQIRTIQQNRLGDYMGHCTEYEMQMIDIALSISLDLKFDGENEKSSGKIDSTLAENRSKNTDFDAETSKSVAKTPEIVAEPCENVIKLTVERDTYKQLYENLLERMMK